MYSHKMSRRLPSLTALRAFEAAARHENLTRAAEELFVTHGAISRQIRDIELDLGTALFERRGRRLALTDAGRDYQRAVTAAFDDLAAATDRLRQSASARRLTLNVLPTFAMRWLIPRLGRFQQLNPKIELRLVTSDRPLARLGEPFDLAVRRGPEAWPGYQAAAFMAEWELPVCSPALLRRKPITTLTDLEQHILLDAETRPDAWQQWLRSVGATHLQFVGRQQFDHFYLCLDAAEDGLGFALGPVPLIADDLLAQRLVAPLPELRRRSRSYHWVVPERLAHDPAIRSLCQWLAEEGDRATAGLAETK
jgi:LysR family glycine cleavage system transcriptional activator